jgi:hypothetical protein
MTQLGKERLAALRKSRGAIRLKRRKLDLTDFENIKVKDFVKKLRSN